MYDRAAVRLGVGGSAHWKLDVTYCEYWLFGGKKSVKYKHICKINKYNNDNCITNYYYDIINICIYTTKTKNSSSNSSSISQCNCGYNYKYK